MRQSAVVKTKDACEEGESRNSASVTTNLVYLSRYAKHLGSQQKFEITKEEQSTESLGNEKGRAVSGDCLGGKKIKEDVLVKDYLPAMKAVCNRLENAKGKVLVISDIKKDLGYIGSSSGHREWRQVLSRLKDAHIVEEFVAEVNEKVSLKKKKVNEKVEYCLRQLKTFSPQAFGCVDDIGDEQIKFGRKCRSSDQLIELPIEHQIYDMIDAAGSEGLTVMEICKRLGIDNKKNHNRLVSMFSRFGMDLQAENHKKCVAYRVWTPGRRNPESANAFSNKPNVANDDRISTGIFDKLVALDRPSNNYPESDPSNLTGGIDTPKKMKIRETNTEISSGSSKDTEANLLSNNSQVTLLESRDEGGLDIVSAEMGRNIVLLETPPVALKPFSSGSHRRHPSLTVDSMRREKKLLERLQNEKFILIPELHKWLVSVEKDKSTTTDRKTIFRLLNKLQQQQLCKCMQINVPGVTNYGGSRMFHVVLHPSESLSPELVSEIYDRLRSFEIQSRGQCSSRSKNNDSVPVLKGVERTKIHVKSDVQAIRSEAMRANGFILAKMIRAKLLHGFLWENLYGSECSNGASSSKKVVFELSNPHSSSKLFSLEAAIKAIPIELFLQVVGSTQKFSDMIEKCKRGLCLSDLSVQEYKSLMDAHATGRLSMLVDILRRLKLLRMVSGECAKDGSQLLQATFTHAMELKPYIEEPISKAAISLSFRPLDLRPRIRHDFVLSNRKAVDEYWQTLEYCYAAADPRAALHAFPGSAVHEVFLFRSWASVRVMTADQRAELLKRVMKDDQSGKLSFKDCGKIAKDLNLSLEQVLRVYYDKRQSRLNKFPGERDDFQTLRSNRISSLRIRERSPEMRSVKFRKVDEVTGQLGKQSCGTSPDTKDSFMEGELLVPPEKHEMDLQAFQEDDHLENGGNAEPNEDDEDCYSAFSRMKPARQRRFSWTEEADRQMVIQYSRYRAALGAKYHRTDWASIPNLPAPRSPCKKRMALLNKNVRFREALMRLCNILSARYVKFLEKMENKLLEKDDCKSGEGIDTNSDDSGKHTRETCSEEEPWDDFDNDSIKVALDEVLRCKWMAKLDASKRVGSTYEEWSDLNIDAEKHDSELAATISSSGDVQNLDGKQQKLPIRRSRAQRLHKKLINLLNEEVKVSRKVYNSVAISNAVELFKLIFLSTSTSPAVSNRLAEILRHYSEHDLFAAFNFLRERKFMVGGSGNQPFSLSQQFMHNVSKSPFPTNSGNRAAKCAHWLHERENDLTGGGLDLSDDLQCGDIFHLFALVSLGQLSLSPCLPDEGVGEAEDTRGLKRKIDTNESPDSDKGKKLKSLVAAEGEIISRREKGFPGIVVSINRTGFSTAEAVDLVRDTCTDELDGKDTSDTTSGPDKFPHLDHIKEMQDSGCNISTVENSSESPWIAMSTYAASLLPIHSDQEKPSPIDPEIFRAVYAAIPKAGDQGLSIEEVSQVINIPGEKMSGLIISVLQTFGRALKVNTFNSVHVVDALYRSKYFLTSAADTCQVLKAPSWVETIQDDVSRLVLHDSGGAYTRGEINVNADDVHKVSLLNFPEEVTESFNENQTSNVHGGCMQGELVLTGGAKADQSVFSSGELCLPILPWINGDGRINKAIYKGLRRRALGIVMQNPGILEDEIINQMDVLNPQSCRKLLEMMILDKHLVVKKMHQTMSNSPPAILATFFRTSFSKPKLVCREHFFANPLSTSLL